MILVLGFVLACHGPARAQTEPAHPILGISGSGSGADAVLSGWTEAQYTNSFVPHGPPRNDDYGFVPPVVSGDTGWSWNAAAPNQIVSTPSGTVFPGAPGYPLSTQWVAVMNGNTVPAPYYLRAGSTSAKSLVLALIDHNKRNRLRSDLDKLAPAYMSSGGTHAARNQAYARRIALALLDWARWFPNYYLTGKNSASFIDTGPEYILGSDLQRASDHNGLAHEWADDELLAFDAIYDSPALATLASELGFDVRGYIKTNLFCDEGNFIVYHVPVDVAIQSNLSGPYTVLGLVARVLNRPDYILWLDEYLDATVRQKIRRDGALSEGMGYSIGYLNENVAAARNTRDYFLTRPADTPALLSISNRAGGYVTALTYGQAQWSKVALPNGQLASFGDTPFNNYFTARNTGNSALLPAYGTLCLGAGASSSTAVQVNQNFSGDNNHMRSDTTAYTLWAFGNEYLGNIRYHNGTPGRQFTEQILAHNAVTIDRADMASPSANTYGNGDLTLYEPGNNGLAVSEIDGQRAYSNKASRYQRLLILNTRDLNRPYLVDLLRVSGGTNHDYVFHGSIRYDSTWECSFPLATNPTTYPMLEGGEVWTEPTSSGSSFPYYGFWRNVSSNQAPGDFQITYRDTGSSHRDVRLWMPDNGTAKVYLGRTPVPSRANGEPADYWVNGLWRPSAIIRKRVTSGPLQNLFVTVVEPMRNGVSTIQSVERLPTSGSNLESCALRITFTDGREDTCLVNLRSPQVAGANTGSATVSTTNGQYSLTGRVGFHTTGPAGASVCTVHASGFQYPAGWFSSTNAGYSGWILGETARRTGASNDAFVTTTPLPLGVALRGRQLSLTFGSLSGSGTTGISEMFEIDQVLLTNGQYHICLAQDHMLEITNGTATVEQMAPLRTFAGSNQFEIALSASPAPTTNASTGLVARLTFDDGTASDSSGWGNHGTLVNGAAVVNDPARGNVLFLNGTNGYVDLGNGPSLDLSGNSQATVTAWIKVALSHNHNMILSKGEWKEAYSLGVKGDSIPKDQLWTGNDISVSSGNPVPLNTWTHAAVTINGDATTFYLNGQVSGAANQDRGNPIDFTATGVSIGREQYAGSMPAGRWFFNGWMDDVRIYNRALSAVEIQTIVVGHPPPPLLTGLTLSGSNLTFRATDGLPGSTVWLLSTTNLVLPASSWAPVATNVFGPDGTFATTNLIDASEPPRFYRLFLPEP